MLANEDFSPSLNQVIEFLKDKGKYSHETTITEPDYPFWVGVYEYLLTVDKDGINSKINLWDRHRRLIAVMQLMCFEKGITQVGKIDGLIGPSTRLAFHIFVEGPQEWRDKKETLPLSKTVLDKSKLPTVPYWPTQSMVRSQSHRAFGRAGENQTLLYLPKHIPLVLAWDERKSVTRFSCHEKVVDTLTRIYVNTFDAYGEERFKDLGFNLFGGCFNHRPIRGGTALSIHSWGCALDIDPARNQLRWKSNRARMARPEYDKFWNIVKDEKVVGLGPARNYDWMHIQMATI